VVEPADHDQPVVAIYEHPLVAPQLAHT
jgi:hypothetical protein